MGENVFQILLLLAYLAIALISITIGVYAISVSYLGRETSRSISRKRRRVTELKENLASLSTRIKNEKEVGAIEKEIAHYKKEQKQLEGGLLWLSVKGAVYAPTTFFSVSLLLSVLGILEVLNPDILLAFSSVFIIIGGFCLGKTLKSTERAALEIPKPKYDVFFGSTELMTKRCKANTRIELYPIIHNIGDERSENALVVIFVPKGIKVEDVAEGWKKALGIKKAIPYGDFADSYSQFLDVVNVDAYNGLGGLFVVAKKTGTYKFSVEVKEKTGKSSHELILEVE